MDDLYEVLFEGQSVPCLARTQKGRQCKNNAKWTPFHIGPILSKLNKKIISDEFSIDSADVSTLLKELASLLFCAAGHKNVHCGRYFDQKAEIVTTLRRRLTASTLGYAKTEEGVAKKLSSKGSSGKDQEDNSDQNQDQESGSAGDDSESSNQDGCVSRQISHFDADGNPSTNSYSATYSYSTPTKPRRPATPYKASWPSDNGSPDSTFSTPASAIFSPPPTTSSTFSSESEYECRRRTRSFSRRLEESPTRLPASGAPSPSDLCKGFEQLTVFNDEESDLSDGSVVSNATDVEDEECEYEFETDAQSQSEDELSVGDEHEESQSQPRTQPFPSKAEPFGPPKRINSNMGFASKKDKKAVPVRDILKKMRTLVGAKSMESGYVYWFREQYDTHWKIGCTKSEPGTHDTDIIITPDDLCGKRVLARIKEQKKECEFQITSLSAMYMPCAVKKMESLIHCTLEKYNVKVVRCRLAKCTKSHREWFNVDENTIISTVKVWKQFSNQIPYSKRGTLRDHWDVYAYNQYISDEISQMDLSQWFYGLWRNHISIMKPLSETCVQIRKMQKRMDKLKKKSISQKGGSREKLRVMQHELEKLREKKTWGMQMLRALHEEKK